MEWFCWAAGESGLRTEIGLKRKRRGEGKEKGFKF
jgi:hypothetical protein